MIVVRVDLDSALGSHRDKSLFVMVIANDATGTMRVGNYNVYLGRRGTLEPHRVIESPLRRGRVEGHRRKSTHVGTLIQRALKSVDL